WSWTDGPRPWTSSPSASSGSRKGGRPRGRSRTRRAGTRRSAKTPRAPGSGDPAPWWIWGRRYFFSSAFFSGSFLASLVAGFFSAFFISPFFSAFFSIFLWGFFSVFSSGLAVSVFAGGVVGAWAQTAEAATAPTANKRVKVVIRNRFIHSPPYRGCVSAPSVPSEGRRPARNAYSPAPRLIAEGSCENFTGGRLRKRRNKADRRCAQGVRYERPGGRRGRQAGGLIAADPSLAASPGRVDEYRPCRAHTSPGDAYLVGSGRTISIGVARARRRHEGGAIQWSRRTTEEPGAVRLMELDV